MFGRYFGARYFSPRYWGRGGNVDPTPCEFYFTGWEDGSIGSAPTGWTQRGTSSDHALTVANTYPPNSPPYKRRVAALTSEDANLIAFSVDAIDAFSERDEADVVLGVFREADASPTFDHERVEVHVRGQGSGTITDGYRFAIDFLNQRIRIYKRVSSSDTNPFSDFSITHDAGDWMLYRFRISGSGTTLLKARTWDPEVEEPDAWDLEESDSSSPITAAGWVAVGGYTSTPPAQSKINFLSVATGGCSASVPTLNSRFIAWLRSPARRCVIAELEATGYDSDSSPPGTKTVKAYISNMGYNSHASDDPPNQHYRNAIASIPTFKREMSTALSGRATTSIGKLVVKNPRSSISGAGERDDWLRMKWKRDFVRLWIGDQSWAKSDFRSIVVGCLGQPLATNTNQIEFEITDIIERLNRPLQTNRISSGPFAGQLAPIMAGAPAWVEPIPTGTNEYQVNDGPVASIGDVYDEGVALGNLDFIVASVDTGTDTITTTADHGLSVNDRVLFVALLGPMTPPDPLVAGTYYYVLSVPSSDEFTLSATRGGPVIDLTDSGSGTVTFESFGWWEDLTNGKFTVNATPAGRIIVQQPRAHANTSANHTVAQIIHDLIFDRLQIPLDYKDQDSFDQLDVDCDTAAGIVFYDRDSVTALNALARIAQGSNCWYTSTNDGILQVGRLGLPSESAVMEFTASEVQAGSLKLTSRILPVNRETLAVRYDKQYLTGGPINLVPTGLTNTGILLPYTTRRGTSWGAGTVPLDSHPDRADVLDRPPMDSVFTSLFDESPTEEVDRLQTLFEKTLGVFTFQTTIKAIELGIGKTIQLDFPRLGWKQYTGYDPQSPDNDEDFDATKAVVIGIDVNLSAENPFPVKLTVFRQIPGYYPEANLE